MTDAKPLDDLEFGIPEVEEQNTSSPNNEESFESSRKEPWNPQPLTGGQTITDKNGNAF